MNRKIWCNIKWNLFITIEGNDTKVKGNHVITKKHPDWPKKK